MQFRDNVSAHRYELDTADGTSFATYREGPGARLILHVETPAHARGKGHGGELMAQIVERARLDGRRLRASCSFAAAYFNDHPETADVQA